MKNQTTCQCTAETLAMASVPMQEWCEPFDLAAAIHNGTLFPCLNMNFFDAEDIPCPFCDKPALTKAAEQEKALIEICKIGFALNDLTLYLDTHPDCQNGINLMKDLLQQRLDALAEFAKNHYPLTQLSIVTGTPETKQYGWDEGPLPWDPFASCAATKPNTP